MGSLAAGASCNVSVKFTPTALGTRFGTVTISDTDPTSPQVLPLTGVGSEVGISPTSLSFANQAVGTSSNPQTVTLTNSGSSNINVTKIAVLGIYNQSILFDFTSTTDCIGILAPQAQCSVNVTFVPDVTGPITATVAIYHSDPDSPVLVPVSGTGVGTPMVSLAPGSLDFGNQRVGTSSTPLPITLTNTGTAILNVSSILASGPFSESDDCRPTVAAGASCTVNVTFTPVTTGGATGTITFSDNASDSPQAVSLTGTGD
jgi:archaellum component FlaF (FlaF/FlaG flagellin family)